MSTKKLKTKVIAVGLTGVVVSGVVLNQQYEIRQLERDLQIQKILPIKSITIRRLVLILQH